MKKKSIVIKLKGGIGNQFFQIAFGLKLSRIRGWELLFEDSFFSNDPYGHSSVLHAFPELKKLQFSHIIGDVKSVLIQEEKVNDVIKLFNPETTISNDISIIYFDGYWQDKKYFDDIDVTFLKNGLSNFYINSKIKTRLPANESNFTSIHFRRKDYRHHGLCGDLYYIFSLQYFLQQRNNLNLLVFSDEPNATNFLLQSWKLNYTFINSGCDLSDLYIMSMCKNHIIANSTFSWWGSTLAGTNNVIYPDEWSKIHIPAKNLFNENWICISNSMEEAKPKLINIKLQ